MWTLMQVYYIMTEALRPAPGWCKGAPATTPRLKAVIILQACGSLALVHLHKAQCKQLVHP